MWSLTGVITSWQSVSATFNVWPDAVWPQTADRQKIKQKLNIKQELAETARHLAQVRVNISDAEQQRLDELSEREIKIKELESQQIAQKKRIEQEWKILQ